jgi:putative alpha-1,2-mannosidase
MKDNNTFKFLVDYITSEVIKLLVDDKHISIEEAMILFHNSETFEKLMNPQTGFYEESPQFMYGVFNDELKFGSLKGLTE